MKARLAPSTFGDFRCGHCHALVSSAHLLSGVNNRNHCPYCLWSCHLDLFTGGDRLSACKAPMKPIGLTAKRSRNKYAHGLQGELMLVHECTDCQALSINRIAADDSPETILAVFQASLGLDPRVRARCLQNGITILGIEHAEVIRTQLYGRPAGTAYMTA